GLANTTSPSAPTSYTAYTWALIKGEDGQDGIPGPPGQDGQTTYTWVRYADDENGSGMSDSPNGKLYIGLAFNKTTPNESSNPSDYTWSLMPQNIEIGGRNYVRDSLFQKGNEFWNLYGPGTTEFVDGAFRGYRAVRRAVNETVNVWAGMWSLANGIEVSLGDKVTASVWYKVESDADVLAIEVEYFPNPDRSEGRIGHRELVLENTVGDWKYAEATFATANFEGYDKVYAFFRVWVQQRGTVLYALPKLEKGNKATDWTPAPEDIEQEILDLDDKLGEQINTITEEYNTAIELAKGEINLEIEQTLLNNEQEILEQIRTELEAS